MIECNEFPKDDLFRINDVAKLYNEVPECMKKLVLHVYRLGFSDGYDTYGKEVDKAIDMIIHETSKEEL